jgi:hypothetical protein
MAGTTTKSKATVLAGSIVSIFGPIAFIGDFQVGTKKSIIVGVIILISFLLMIILPVAIGTRAATATTPGEVPSTSYGVGVVAAIIVSGLAFFVTWVLGLVFNWSLYNKMK